MNIGQDITFEMARLRETAANMDALFRISGTRITVGLDNILGLVPVAGDAAALLPSLWIIWQARQLGATRGALAYMVMNTGIDFIVGSIPIVGDLFDVAYNANVRNVAALERNLERKASVAREVNRKSSGMVRPNINGLLN